MIAYLKQRKTEIVKHLQRGVRRIVNKFEGPTMTLIYE